MNAYVIRQTRRACYLYVYAGESVELIPFNNRRELLAAMEGR
jgi:hypothetical protein